MSELSEVMEFLRDHVSTKSELAEFRSHVDQQFTEVRQVLSEHTEILNEHTQLLQEHSETLAAHTTALDALVKNTKDWNTEQMVMRGRLDRHDQWFRQIADHLDLRLDS